MLATQILVIGNFDFKHTYLNIVVGIKIQHVRLSLNYSNHDLESGFVEGIEQKQQQCQDYEGGKQTSGFIHFVRVAVLVVAALYKKRIIDI